MPLMTLRLFVIVKMLEPCWVIYMLETLIQQPFLPRVSKLLQNNLKIIKTSLHIIRLHYQDGLSDSIYHIQFVFHKYSLVAKNITDWFLEMNLGLKIMPCLNLFPNFLKPEILCRFLFFNSFDSSKLVQCIENGQKLDTFFYDISRLIYT